jgi:hypothetical protein
VFSGAPGAGGAGVAMPPIGWTGAGALGVAGVLLKVSLGQLDTSPGF